MPFIDSHCHPQYLIEGDYTKEKFIKDISSLYKVLMVSVEPDDAILLHEIAQQSPNAFFSYGIHPSYVHKHSFETIEHQVKNNSDGLIALGETGLDYYHTEQFVAQQKRSFHAHCQLALESHLPIIVHTRAAASDTLSILSDYQALQGVIHCFTETKEFAKKVLDMGLYISFSGIITFKNAADLRDVVKYCPLDRILSETDAPFLAPVPYRGKVNQPRYVSYVVHEIAKIKNITIDQCTDYLNKNSLRLFPLMSD